MGETGGKGNERPGWVNLPMQARRGGAIYPARRRHDPPRLESDSTGGPAQWFFLGSAAISGKRAQVTTGFHINGRLYERFECDLRQTVSGWSVTGCTLVAAA